MSYLSLCVWIRLSVQINKNHFSWKISFKISGNSGITINDWNPDIPDNEYMFWYSLIFAINNWISVYFSAEFSCRLRVKKRVKLFVISFGKNNKLAANYVFKYISNISNISNISWSNISLMSSNGTSALTSIGDKMKIHWKNIWNHLWRPARHRLARIQTKCDSERSNRLSV